MSKTFALIFGALLACALLLIYLGSILYMAYGLWTTCQGAAVACTSNSISLNEGFQFVFTTVGGLVSALVVAQLTVTRPGDAPTIGNFKAETGLGQRRTEQVVGAYLLVWMICGFLALVVGVMFYNKVNSTLSDAGTGWLGMAVSAAYAYFGINPGGNIGNGAAAPKKAPTG